MNSPLRDEPVPVAGPESAAAEGGPWRLGALGLLALCIMAPVTLPVPVLRELVQDRFEVSELLTSAFMSMLMLMKVLERLLVNPCNFSLAPTLD